MNTTTIRNSVPVTIAAFAAITALEAGIIHFFIDGGVLMPISLVNILILSQQLMVRLHLGTSTATLEAPVTMAYFTGREVNRDDIVAVTRSWRGGLNIRTEGGSMWAPLGVWFLPIGRSRTVDQVRAWAGLV